MPPELILMLLGLAALAVALVIAVIVAAALISPQWFSRSCSTMLGAFTGMTAAALVVLVIGCACLAVFIAAAVAVLSEM